MNTLEYVSCLYKMLGTSEQKAILKKATEMGMVVPGFSKRAFMAPPNIVIKCLGQKTKNDKIYFYDIMLSALAFKAKDGEDSVYSKAKEWIINEDSHDRLSEEVSKLQKNEKQEIENIERDLEETNNGDVEKIQELTDLIKQLREKNKKQKSIIQENKIELDNLRGKTDRYEKESSIFKKEKEQYEAEINGLNDQINELAQELHNSKINEESLKEEIEELRLFKLNVPKILCISKKNLEVPIKGFDVTIINSWSEDIENRVREFGEIWYVHKGFSCNVLNEIRNMAVCNIREFISADSLVRKMAGGTSK